MTDAPTRRFGGYMATLYGLQFVTGLLGVGGQVTVAVFALVVFVAAMALREGQEWGRTILVGALAVCVVLGLIGVLIAIADGVVLFLVLVIAVGVLVLQLVAASFTMGDRPAALPFPEEWRPWATSANLHNALLAVGLVGIAAGLLL